MAESVLQTRNSPAQALRLLGAAGQVQDRDSGKEEGQCSCQIILWCDDTTGGKITVYFAYFFIKWDI